MALPTLKANGNIYPCRFVKLDPSGDHLVLQAGAGDKCIGVSQRGQHAAPLDGLESGNYAATQASPELQISTFGETVEIDCGGTITPGDRLKSDANGKAITAGATDPSYAVAIEAGTATTSVLVFLVPMYSAT